jgi:hypothetical protein
MVPFIPNAEQQIVLAWLEDTERQEKPVRFIILKARQLGMTTLAMALWFHMCIFKPFVRCQVIGHRNEDTRKIAAIPYLMNQYLPGAVISRCKATKKGHNLYWSNDSWLESTTQGADEGGRGDAPTAVHATELSSWDALRVSRTAEEVLQGFFTPVNLVHGTYLGCESTAGMAAGSMYDRFIDAHTGKPGLWKSFFFSWQGIPKYALAVDEETQQTHTQMVAVYKHGNEKKAMELAGKLDYEQVWFERAIHFGLEAGEVIWAQAKIRDMKGDLRRFDQEFPLRWQDAFVAGGRPVFDQYVVSNWEKEKPPETTVIAARLVEKDGRIDVDILGDTLHIFKPPAKDHEYIVGTDSAAGVTDGDYSPVVVFDRHTREFVAVLYDKMPPDEQADQAAMLQRWYNKAYLIPEINGHGYAAVRRMLDLGCGIHRRYPGREMKPGSKWSDSFGFMTTKSNRQMVIDILAEAVRTDSITVWSKQMMSEMRTFVYNIHNRADHMAGRKSDGIVCACLCLYADQILRPPAGLNVDPDAPVRKGASKLNRWRDKRREDRKKKKRGVHPRLGSFA